MKNLWSEDTEKDFFKKSLAFATPEQLFYVTDSGRYLAYWPRDYQGRKGTIQSRNSLIGNYTEKWARDIIQEIVKSNKLYAVQGAVCKDIALTRQSPADVVISKSKGIEQEPEDILVIFEVKMSLTWNWQYINRKLGNYFKCIGDYKTHAGNPGLLRSDSMLKAIGKSINIRVSSPKAANIPIVVLGNTPITRSYYNKVDHLKKAGIIQGFWSLNPKPLDDDNDSDNIKATPKGGFYRFDNLNELKDKITELYSNKMSFFSSMKSTKELGQIIEIANKEKTYEGKGELFIKLIGE